MTDKETLEFYVHIISAIKNYHERMMLGVGGDGNRCKGTCDKHEKIGKCPTIAFTDCYYEALEKCIELLNIEIQKL